MHSMICYAILNLRILKRLIPEGQAERQTYSYKVTVCSENVEAILKPEFWPNDIGYRVFNQNHRVSENQKKQ